MAEIGYSADFIAGFTHAVECLGQEGDHRGVDWSAAYEYLAYQSGHLPLAKENEIQKLQREIAERTARLQFLVYGDPRKCFTVPTQD